MNAFAADRIGDHLFRDSDPCMRLLAECGRWEYSSVQRFFDFQNVLRNVLRQIVPPNEMSTPAVNERDESILDYFAGFADRIAVPGGLGFADKRTDIHGPVQVNVEQGHRSEGSHARRADADTVVTNTALRTSSGSLLSSLEVIDGDLIIEDQSHPVGMNRVLAVDSGKVMTCSARWCIDWA